MSAASRRRTRWVEAYDITGREVTMEVTGESHILDNGFVQRSAMRGLSWLRFELRADHTSYEVRAYRNLGYAKAGEWWRDV